MQLGEIEPVIADSYRRLLAIAHPPIKYFLLADVAGRANEDPLVRKATEECTRYPPKLKLLDTLRSDGTWPIPRQRRIPEIAGPGPPIGWTYITMLRNLFMLSEYQTDRSEGYVNRSLERILGWQKEDGHVPGPWTDIFPLPHYNGFALRALISFGLEKDARTQKLIRWLLKMQRRDGGWLSPYLDDVRYLPSYKFMRLHDFTEKVRRGEIEYGDPAKYADVPSCTWGTLLVIRGMTLSKDLARLPEVRKAASLVLSRFFTKNPVVSFQRSEDYWTKLKYPNFSGSGLLALDILTWMGIGSEDPRLERPIAWLLGSRGKDGFWMQSERPHPERDQWITVIALSILERYAKSLRGEPFGIGAPLGKNIWLN